MYTTFWSFFVLNLTSCTKTGVEYTKHKLVLFFPLKLRYYSQFSISCVKQSLLFPDIILEYNYRFSNFLHIRSHCYSICVLSCIPSIEFLAICRYIYFRVKCFTVTFFFFSKLDTLLPIRYIFRSETKIRQICGKNYHLQKITGILKNNILY